MPSPRPTASSALTPGTEELSSTACVWSGQSGQVHAAAYTAKVRVSVRAGDTTIVREGSGTGESRASTPGQAHELALKGAETDATKRALATFGNPFGLALYDREQAGVRKMRGRKPQSTPSRVAPGYCAQTLANRSQAHETETSFVGALKQAMSETHDIELLYDVWEQNIETLRVLHGPAMSGLASFRRMVSHLRACAVDLVKRASNWKCPSCGQGAMAGPGRRSTRAFSPSASRNGSAARSISALSPSSLVSFADDHLARSSHPLRPVERARAQGER